MDESDAATTVARQTLADILGQQPETMRVVSIEPMEWRDSSLGCPQPGMMYMQVITPGYRITLEHAGQHYALHTDHGRRAVHCPASDSDMLPITR